MDSTFLKTNGIFIFIHWILFALLFCVFKTYQVQLFHDSFTLMSYFIPFSVGTAMGIIVALLRLQNRKYRLLIKEIENSRHDSKLFSLFSTGPVVVFKWKNCDHWPVEFVSSNVQTIFGFTAEEFISGKIKYSDLIDPLDLERVTKEVTSMMSDDVKSVIHLPYKIINKDGQKRTIQDSTIPIKDEEGHITHFFGHIIDITSMDAEREKVIELNKRFELAIKATKDGLWDWNPISNEIFYSEKWKNILGYSGDEIGNTLNEWIDRVHPHDLEAANKDINDHLQGKTDFYENIHRLKHKNGSWVWILDRGKALLDAQGRPTHIIGFQTDLTKQKQLELELKETILHTNLAAKVAHLGHWDFDFENMTLSFSEELYDIFGIKQQNSITTYDHFLAYVHPEDKELVKKSYFSSIEAGRESFSIQHRIFTQDYTELWLQQFCYNVKDLESRIVKSLGVAIDITRIKNTEIELRQLLSQSSKLALMGELIEMIVHQLKQPLNNIMLAAQTLSALSFEELKHIESSIQEQVLYMSETMDDFKNFLNPSKQKIIFLACEEIQRVIDFMAPQTKSKGVKILVEGHQCFKTSGIKNEFTQVILAIVTNSLDQIRLKNISNATIIIKITHHSDTATITIQDNAGGIAPELLPDKLFNTYVSTKGLKGTGLGLRICKMIIEDSMNGKIFAANKDQGALFSIVIPKINEPLQNSCLNTF